MLLDRATPPPDIQEALLFLPGKAGRQVTERDLRSISMEVCWGRQSEMWRGVTGLRH